MQHVTIANSRSKSLIFREVIYCDPLFRIFREPISHTGEKISLSMFTEMFNAESMDKVVLFGS